MGPLAKAVRVRRNVLELGKPGDDLDGACCIASCRALMFSCVLAEHQWVVVAVPWWVGLSERAAAGPNRGSHALALAGCAGLVVLPLLHLFRYGRIGERA